MKNVVIVDEKDLVKKKEVMIRDGPEKLHLVSDFDRTVTYGLTGEGRRTATVISQLRSDPKYLGADYKRESEKLFDIYRPIETDSKISLEEKKRKMHEWWMRHFELIGGIGLTQKLIRRVVKEKPLQFRKYSLEVMSFLNENDVPVIFISAAPGDMLNEYLRQNKLLFPNIFVIANLYEWDSDGNALRIREPIIHSKNKDETAIKDFPIYAKIKSRTNVILLGDSPDDVEMVHGFKYKNLIKVGFLNEEMEKNLEVYKRAFDVVITGDSDMSYVYKLLREIVGK